MGLGADVVADHVVGHAHGVVDPDVLIDGQGGVEMLQSELRLVGLHQGQAEAA